MYIPNMTKHFFWYQNVWPLTRSDENGWFLPFCNMAYIWIYKYSSGTHHLRSINNRYQPWSNLKVRKDMGLRSMNPTEEGLASLHSVLYRKDPSLWRAAVLYYTVYKASQMSLKELFRDLGQYVQDPNVRWDYCIRAKRGQTDTSRPGMWIQ